MCGIVCQYNFDWRSKVHKNHLKRMADAIGHRGPDGDGYWVRNNLGLAHRRLSIIDLKTGSQPMAVRDDRVLIVHNGEIYNYLEIRTELRRLGYHFSTNSDTEVILNSYLEWGEECVLRFNGMWAFVVVDIRKDSKLFCSRDRLGIKPFYYLIDARRFVCGSEIKAFFELDNFLPTINKQVLWDSLVFGPKSFGETYIEGVSELEAGCNLTITNGNIRTEKYFNLESTFEAGKLRFEESEIESLLQDAIKMRLRSDVPLATINSGGLDSSLISAISRKQKRNLRTYSVAPAKNANGKPLSGDESSFAEILARHIHCDHETIRYSSESFCAHLRDAVYANDGELYHSNSVPLKLLFQAIKRDGITVVLGGEGADEVFRGYYSNRLLNFLKVTGPVVGKFILLQKYLNRTDILNYFKDVKRCIPLLRSNYLAPQVADKLLNVEGELHQDRKQLFEIMNALSPENGLCYYEQKTYLAGLLRRADRMSMAHHIELRVPYLDHRLVQHLNKIDFKEKSGISTAAEKKILKRLARPLLPVQILERKKYGFGSPLYSYREYLRKRVLKYVDGTFNLDTNELWIVNTIIHNELHHSVYS